MRHFIPPFVSDGRFGDFFLLYAGWHLQWLAYMDTQVTGRVKRAWLSVYFRQLQRYDVLEASPSSSYPGIQERTVEQIVDIPVPHFLENVVEVVQIVPQERVLIRTVEQIVDTPTLQSQDEIVEVIQLILQEGISERILEQIVEVPVPQMEEQIVEVVKIIPPERVLR